MKTGGIFWVQCPECGGRHYCDYQLRHKKSIKLECPRCHKRFGVDESPEIDDRQK